LISENDKFIKLFVKYLVNEGLIDYEEDYIIDIQEVIENEIAEFGFEGTSLIYQEELQSNNMSQAIKYVLLHSRLKALNFSDVLKIASHSGFNYSDKNLEVIETNSAPKKCKICGFRNIHGLYDICLICKWEADGTEDDGKSYSGCNRATVAEYRKSWRENLLKEATSSKRQSFWHMVYFLLK